MKAITAVLLLSLSATSALAQSAPPRASPVEPPMSEWPKTAPDIQSAISWRATIMVDDWEKSVAIYQGALGLVPVYPPQVRDDRRIYPYRGLKPGEQYKHQIFRSAMTGKEKLHLGYIALAQVLDATGKPVKLEPSGDARVRTGEVELMFVSEDILGVHEKLKKIAGVQIVNPPEKRDDGTYSQIMAIDPNGMRLWITSRKTISLFFEDAPYP